LFLASFRCSALSNIASDFDNSCELSRRVVHGEAAVAEAARTARNHVSIIFGKPDIASRAEAVAVARDAGYGGEALRNWSDAMSASGHPRRTLTARL
jgi:ribonucleotide monophosphatase NagD (HAD superfamily)